MVPPLLDAFVQYVIYVDVDEMGCFVEARILEPVV
jgi:hypothetical protein